MGEAKRRGTYEQRKEQALSLGAKKKDKVVIGSIKRTEILGSSTTGARHRARLMAIASIFALLNGCATLSGIDQDAALGGYTKCAAADVVTTAAGLSLNVIHETNPLTNALAIKAFGAVGGVVVPVIGLSIAGYYLLKWINRPIVTTVAAGVTCFSAGRNVFLMR